jgi:hypothetical protein
MSIGIAVGVVALLVCCCCLYRYRYPIKGRFEALRGLRGPKTTSILVGPTIELPGLHPPPLQLLPPPTGPRIHYDSEEAKKKLEPKLQVTTANASPAPDQFVPIHLSIQQVILRTCLPRCSTLLGAWWGLEQ